MTNLETLKQQTADLEAKLEETTEKLKSMKAEIERLENGWEMKCPYEEGDEYYFVSANGLAKYDSWGNYDFEKRAFAQGNIFKTQQEAELEAKRRNLLTRFREFRNECNGDWEPYWSGYDIKWSISRNEDGLFDTWTTGLDTFAIFGYFKNQSDCERAIELFGQEIKELFMEGE